MTSLAKIRKELNKFLNEFNWWDGGLNTRYGLETHLPLFIQHTLESEREKYYEMGMKDEAKCQKEMAESERKVLKEKIEGMKKETGLCTDDGDGYEHNEEYETSDDKIYNQPIDDILDQL